MRNKVVAALEAMGRESGRKYITGMDLLTVACEMMPPLRSVIKEWEDMQVETPTVRVSIDTKSKKDVEPPEPEVDVGWSMVVLRANLDNQGSYVGSSEEIVPAWGSLTPNRVFQLVKPITSRNSAYVLKAAYGLILYILDSEVVTNATLEFLQFLAYRIALVNAVIWPSPRVSIVPESYMEFYEKLNLVINSQKSSLVLIAGPSGAGKQSFLRYFRDEMAMDMSAKTYHFEAVYIDAQTMVFNPGYENNLNNWIGKQLRKSATDKVMLYIAKADICFNTRNASTFHKFCRMALQNVIKVVASLNTDTLSNEECRELINRGAVILDFPEMKYEDVYRLALEYRKTFMRLTELQMPESFLSHIVDESYKLSIAQPEAFVRLFDLTIRSALRSHATGSSRIEATAQELADCEREMCDARSILRLRTLMDRKELLSTRLGDCYKVSELTVSDKDLECAWEILSRHKSLSKKRSFDEVREELARNILGQEEAIDQLCKGIRRLQWKVKQTATCGNFLFVGPTSVGKTELAKQLANSYFSSGKLIQFDMSEFLESHTISKLIGSPPGYRGCDEPSLLATKIQAAEEGVLLFDEVEKAHPSVINLLLQMMEEGFVTDSSGRKIDCSKFFIILTSNTGIHELSQKKTVGFTKRDKFSSEDVMTQVKKEFTPELLNRLDSVIVFKSISTDVFRQLVSMYLHKAAEPFKQRGVRLAFGEGLIEYLSDKGFSEEYGVRFLKRSIESEVVDAVLDVLADRDVQSGTYMVDYLGTIEEGSVNVTPIAIEKETESITAEVFSDEIQSLLDGLVEKNGGQTKLCHLGK